MANFFLSRRFLPLFATQFLGAANDNFLKNALLLWITCRLGTSTAEAGFLSNLAAGLFILPFFLFSASAGQFADKLDKARYVRIVKLIEILLMAAAWIGFYFPTPVPLLLILFLMGTQSAFFGPAKYALLPQLLKEKELLPGNAWIGAGTYIAILAGVIGSGLLMALPSGPAWCGPVLFLAAVAGYAASRSIPSVTPDDPTLKIDWNLLRQTRLILRDAVWNQPVVRHCILSSSFFWLTGSLYLTQAPLFCNRVLGGGELVCTWFFVLFSVGVGIGSLLANLIQKGKITVGRLQFGAILGMALLSLNLALLARTPPAPTQAGWRALTGTPLFWNSSVNFLLIAVCGGVWMVPLQALMQHASRREVLARAIAGNNIINALAMTAGAVGAMLLMKYGSGTSGVFFWCGILLVPIAFYTACRRPKES